MARDVLRLEPPAAIAAITGPKKNSSVIWKVKNIQGAQDVSVASWAPAIDVVAAAMAVSMT